MRSRVNASALSCRRAERSQQLVNVKVARDMLQAAREREGEREADAKEKEKEKEKRVSRTSSSRKPSTNLCRICEWHLQA